jgi:hypothetical protein
MRVGYAGNDIRQYLHRRPLWNKLRQDYEAKGEKLVPLSGDSENWSGALHH